MCAVIFVISEYSISTLFWANFWDQFNPYDTLHIDMNDISAVKQYYEFPSNPVKVMKNLL